MGDTISSKEIKKQPQLPVIKKTSFFYLIWILPLAALFLCLLLLWNNYKDDKVTVVVQFDSAHGIVAGKTDVVYNGIVIGQASNVEFSSDLKKVFVSLTMDNKFKPWLTDKTAFWLVKPNVSLTGVTGLETLVSGNYIAIKPNNKGNSATHFTARNEPLIDSNISSLHITLMADSLHSVTLGSPIYFRKIEVGKVINYSLIPQNDSVKIDVVIFPEYKNLVRNNSRFWNVSGFKLSASLKKGIEIEAASVTSLVKGGIAFYTPDLETSSKQSIGKDKFILYQNFEDAQAGVVVNIRFPLHDTAIHKNTSIMFHKLQIGFVRMVNISSDLRYFDAEAVIDPDAIKLLVDGAFFQIIRPKINLSSINNLNALINGPYIAINVSQEAIKKGVAKKQFQSINNDPMAPVKLSGLNLVLKAASLNGIQINSPVFFRDQEIGGVTFTKLSVDGKQVLVYINIKPEYAPLINSSSAFINISGLRIKAGLASGIHFQSSHLMPLITGGIKIITTDHNAQKISHDDDFILHDSEQNIKKGLKLSLITNNAGSVKVGIPVLYLGVPVGEVTGSRLDNPAHQVVISIIIQPPYTSLVTKDSKFWNVSGFEVGGGLLSGIKLESQSIDTIITGGIAFATPRPYHEVVSGSRFMLHASAKDKWKTWNPAIKLNEQKK